MTTKKRICTVIIVLVIVCAVCVGGFFVWKKTGKGGSKSSQKVYVQKVSSLNTASDFKLSNRSFLGVVEAQESVDVKYDSSKTVAEILVKNGDSVKKGDKLLTYDVEAINLQLEQAKLEVERLQNEIASNKSQIAELEKEKKNADLKNQLLRTAAEYDNYRKRSQREADQKFNDGVSHAVTQILGILDTLDMAANAACADENYKKGVTMTLDKAAKALETLHITEIEALNQPFDPNFMNAVQQVPAAEGQESGSVVQVFQKGYKIGDKIIRHAMVVVAE